MDQKGELPPSYAQTQYGAPPQPYGQPAPPPSGYGGYPQPANSSTVVVTTNMQPTMMAPPPDHMVFAILVTLFCCWPIGIFAIIKASSVKDAIGRNDMSGAQHLSQETRKLCNMALGFGLCINLAWIIFVIIYFTVIVSYTASYNPYK